MNRILVIGINGSGKSTLANKLGKILDLPVFHLDKLYFSSGWKPVAKGEWPGIVSNLIAKDEWIIDGNYPNSMDRRIEVSDTIIFLNFNKFLCLYRIFKRIFDKIQPFDRPEGDFHKISWYLIKKVIIYPRKKILAKLEPYRNTKKIFVIKNSQEAEDLLKKLAIM